MKFLARSLLAFALSSPVTAWSSPASSLSAAAAAGADADSETDAVADAVCDDQQQQYGATSFYFEVQPHHATVIQ